MRLRLSSHVLFPVHPNHVDCGIMVEKTALKRSTATKYTVYFPFRKSDEEVAAAIREKILDFIKEIFGGVTVYPAQGTTGKWGEESTSVLEILVEDVVEHKETRIEQLAWLILSYLDELKTLKGRPPEETVWFSEQTVILYKLVNPDLLKRSAVGGSK